MNLFFYQKWQLSFHEFSSQMIFHKILSDFNFLAFPFQNNRLKNWSLPVSYEKSFEKKTHKRKVVPSDKRTSSLFLNFSVKGKEKDILKNILNCNCNKHSKWQHIGILQFTPLKPFIHFVSCLIIYLSYYLSYLLIHYQILLCCLLLK